MMMTLSEWIVEGRTWNLTRENALLCSSIMLCQAAIGDRFRHYAGLLPLSALLTVCQPLVSSVSSSPSAPHYLPSYEFPPPFQPSLTISTFHHLLSLQCWHWNLHRNSRSAGPVSRIASSPVYQAYGRVR
jgi:hypothetical protein